MLHFGINRPYPPSLYLISHRSIQDPANVEPHTILFKIYRFTKLKTKRTITRTSPHPQSFPTSAPTKQPLPNPISILVQDLPILITERVRQIPTEEKILADISVRNIDAQIAIGTADAAVNREAALKRAVDEFVTGADVRGVEVPLMDGQLLIHTHAHIYIYVYVYLLMQFLILPPLFYLGRDQLTTCTP